MRLKFNADARFCVTNWRGIEIGGVDYRDGDLLPNGLDEHVLYVLWCRGCIAVFPEQSIDPNEPDLPGEEEDDAVRSTGSAQTVELAASKRRRQRAA